MPSLQLGSGTITLLDIMAPSTRNSKVCESYGVLIVRVGKGEEERSALVRCQKCCGLVEASLEDRIKDLTNKIR